MAIKDVQEQIVQNQAVENHVLKNDAAHSGLGRAVLVVIGLLTVALMTVWGLYAVHPSDPYVLSVLEQTGDVSRGREIFKLNCAVCHGFEGLGEVGPDLSNVSARKSRVALIEQVISGKTPPMPQFQPVEKDMSDLLSFLETL